MLSKQATSCAGTFSCKSAAKFFEKVPRMFQQPSKLFRKLKGEILQVLCPCRDPIAT